MWQNLFATCFPFRNRLTFFIQIKPEHSFSGACFSFFRLQIYSVFPVFSCTFIQFYSTIVHKSIFYIKKTAISSFLLAKGFSFSPTMHKIKKQGFSICPGTIFLKVVAQRPENLLPQMYCSPGKSLNKVSGHKHKQKNSRITTTVFPKGLKLIITGKTSKPFKTLLQSPIYLI